VKGFLNLGKYTTDADKEQLADHALVIMYQPFRGTWFHTLGAFATHGAARGEILNKIIIEAVGLSEKCGLHVDAVVADGGSWNRKMWKIFGITGDNPSCEHPADPSRRLRFFSDFPHLVKTMWSRVLKAKTLLERNSSENQNHFCIHVT